MNNQGLQNRPTFSSLPRDVKTLIFDFAHGQDVYHASNSPKRLLGLIRPISKAFLEVQQVTLYGDVEFTSYRQLAAFAKTVVKDPHIAKVVKNLVIELDWQSEGTRASPVAVEQVDPRSPGSSNVATLFHSVQNLESLVIVGSSRIAELAMSPAGADTRFKHLKALTLESTFSDWNDPFHPVHFEPLKHWTKLYGVKINVQKASEDLKLEMTPNYGLLNVPQPFPSFPSIKSLDITGPVGIEWAGGPIETTFGFLKTLSAFPSLTSLVVYNTAPSATGFVSRIVDALPNPRLLTFIHLNRSDPSHPCDLSPVILRLPSLKRLIIGGEGLQIKAKFYDNLKQLKNLRSVTFELGLKGVATSNLSKLLIGPGRHTGIEEVFLDHIKHDAGAGCFPEWSAHFKPSGLTKFLSQIKQHGQVTVDGDALWALHRVSEGMSEGELLESIGELKERYARFADSLEGMAL